MSSSSVDDFLAEVEACQIVKKHDKKSLHFPIHVWPSHQCPVDTRAVSCFIQFLLAKKLGVWEKQTKSRHQVCCTNGVVEPVLGIVPLKITLEEHWTMALAYVLHTKGLALILGFTFLEEQGLLVDCKGRRLLPKSLVQPIYCFLATL